MEAGDGEHGRSAVIVSSSVSTLFVLQLHIRQEMRCRLHLLETEVQWIMDSNIMHITNAQI